MRFVFGLIAGATLAVAAASGWGVLQRVIDHVAGGARVVQTLADISPGHASPQPRTAESATAARTTARPGGTGDPSDSGDVPAQPFETGNLAAIGEPATPGIPPPIAEAAPAPALVPAPAEAFGNDDGGEVLADAEAALKSPLPTAPAWRPFARERSARGFAARLEAELGRPFDVQRRAGGGYVVTFGYASDAERDAVLAEIAGVTRGVRS